MSLLLTMVVIACVQLREVVIDVAAPYLPSTVLIRLMPHVDHSTVSEVLCRRVEYSPAGPIVSRMERSQLRPWQWKLIAGQDRIKFPRVTEYDILHECAATIAEAPPSPIRLRPEDILNLKGVDTTWSTIRRFDRSLGIPVLFTHYLWPGHRGYGGTQVGGGEDHYDPPIGSSADIEDSRQRIVRLYSIDCSAYKEILMIRLDGLQWNFIDWLRVVDEKSDSSFEPIDLGVADPGVVIKWSNEDWGAGERGDLWCVLDDEGMHVVLAYWTNRRNSGRTYSVDGTSSLVRRGTSPAGPWVEIEYSLEYWTMPGWREKTRNQRWFDPDEQREKLFDRNITIRYQWNTPTRRFEHDDRDSDLPASRFDLVGYDPEIAFIPQNFDVLVSLAIGDDAEKAAWVRATLERTSDSLDKRRLIREINRHAAKTLIDEP